MKRVLVGALATLALSTGFLASNAFAIAVNWDINPGESSFKLAVPDQGVTIGTISATMRLRNQNNAAWTTNTAPVDGLLATNVGAGITSVEFLGGASSLVGVNTGNYRPNPAAYDTNTTNGDNTAGTFTNTTTGAGVYAARVNASVSIITINTGYISFADVQLDVASIVTAVTAGSFVTTAIDVGILDSQINFDSVNSGTTGIGDTQAQSGSITATNINGSAGSIVNVSGNNYKITVPFNLPVFVDLSGVQLNATATGTLVGYATIVPEPATLALTCLGVAGLAAFGRRRRQA